MNIPISGNNSDPFRNLPLDGEVSPSDAIRIGPLPEGDTERPFASALKQRTDRQSAGARSSNSQPTADSGSELAEKPTIIETDKPASENSQANAAINAHRPDNNDIASVPIDGEPHAAPICNSFLTVATDDPSETETSPTPIGCDTAEAIESDVDASLFDDAVILPFPGAANPPPPKSLIDLISINDTADEAATTDEADTEPIFVQLPQVNSSAGIAPLPASLADVLTVSDVESHNLQQSAEPIDAQVGIDLVHLHAEVEDDYLPQNVSQPSSLQTGSMQIGLFNPSIEIDTAADDATDVESFPTLATTMDAGISSSEIPAEQSTPENIDVGSPLETPRAVQASTFSSWEKPAPIETAAEISDRTDEAPAEQAHLSAQSESARTSIDQSMEVASFSPSFHVTGGANPYQPSAQLSQPTNTVAQSSAVISSTAPAEVPTVLANHTPEQSPTAVDIEAASSSEHAPSTGRETSGVSTPALRNSSRWQGELNPAHQLDRLASLIQQSEQVDRGLVVRLHPPELGALQIEVTRRDGMLTARIEVQTQAAHQLLGDSLPKLHEALAQLGATVERIDLQLVAPEVSQEQPRFDSADQNSQQKSDRQEQNPGDAALQQDQSQADGRDQNASDSSSRRYRLDDPANEDQAGQNATQGPHGPPGQKSRPHFKPLDRIDIHI
ncbi:MAG: flagellar hook-length control protein FliK [Planctomycetaceae bacterium]